MLLSVEEVVAPLAPQQFYPGQERCSIEVLTSRKPLNATVIPRGDRREASFERIIASGCSDSLIADPLDTRLGIETRGLDVLKVISTAPTSL
jgi:hypothetical protein